MKNKGFSAIECIILIAIIGMLAAIVVPSIQNIIYDQPFERYTGLEPHYYTKEELKIVQPFVNDRISTMLKEANSLEESWFSLSSKKYDLVESKSSNSKEVAKKLEELESMNEELFALEARTKAKRDEIYELKKVAKHFGVETK